MEENNPWPSPESVDHCPLRFAEYSFRRVPVAAQKWGCKWVHGREVPESKPVLVLRD
jgi:hypothetical protein